MADQQSAPSVRTVARVLRRVADRLDHRGAPKRTGLYLRFVDGRGAVVTWDEGGCPLWYLGDDDYELAHYPNEVRP